MSKEKIIKILQEKGFSVENFAYEDFPCRIEDYPEAVEAQKVRESFRNNPINRGKDNIGWAEGKSNEYQTLPSEYDIAAKCFKKELGLNWEEVDQYGGEGQGDTWFSIKYFPDYDLYLKVSGYYQSYNGTDFYDGWDCVTEVKPVTKTITVYE